MWLPYFYPRKIIEYLAWEGREEGGPRVRTRESPELPAVWLGEQEAEFGLAKV